MFHQKLGRNVVCVCVRVRVRVCVCVYYRERVVSIMNYKIIHLYVSICGITFSAYSISDMPGSTQNI